MSYDKSIIDGTNPQDSTEATVLAYSQDKKGEKMGKGGEMGGIRLPRHDPSHLPQHEYSSIICLPPHTIRKRRKSWIYTEIQ
jgi:hypothetical protein